VREFRRRRKWGCQPPPARTSRGHGPAEELLVVWPAKCCQRGTSSADRVATVEDLAERTKAGRCVSSCRRCHESGFKQHKRVHEPRLGEGECQSRTGAVGVSDDVSPRHSVMSEDGARIAGVLHDAERAVRPRRSAPAAAVIADEAVSARGCLPFDAAKRVSEDRSVNEKDRFAVAGHPRLESAIVMHRHLFHQQTTPLSGL